MNRNFFFPIMCNLKDVTHRCIYYRVMGPWYQIWSEFLYYCLKKVHVLKRQVIQLRLKFPRISNQACFFFKLFFKFLKRQAM